MTYNIYAIRDVHTGFLSPSVDMNDETAKRNFALMVNNNPGVIGFRPADFDLYHIGEFEADTGAINAINPIRMIVNGASAVGDVK